MTRRPYRWWLFVTCIIAVSRSAGVDAQQSGLTAPPGRGNCAAVLQLKLPDVRITEAVARENDRGITVPYCRVSGVVGREKFKVQSSKFKAKEVDS